MGEPTDDQPVVPSNLPLPRYPLASRTVADSYDAVAQRPTDPYAHTRSAPPETQEPPPRAQWDPAAERRASRVVTMLFVASVLGTALFCCAYLFLDVHAPDLGQLQNLLLGTGLGVALTGVGAGMILVSKKLVPSVLAEQERHEHWSPPEDELAAEHQVLGGVTEMGLGQRRMVRRAMLTALAALPVPFLFGLRDTGPRPRAQLRKSAWFPDAYLLDSDTLERVKVDDVAVGGMMTIVPEGGSDTTLPVNAESIVVLIHLPPGVNRPLPGREDWAVGDLVAYSKICTHAGCPVSLYHSKSHYLLCPCHQSTFDVPDACNVIFGPAARRLPQLPIYADAAGYLRARRGFGVAPGPSFWSRNFHGQD